MEPFKILVIDDERGIREGCRRILESENYQVLLAENGTQGLELAQSDKVDVALIDLKMPGI
ncbi:MAG: response regulator, partial [candidate division KSB1 bacterium]|nr:response regulator [candidate division KSB1 bacterium]